VNPNPIYDAIHQRPVFSGSISNIGILPEILYHYKRKIEKI